MPFLSPPLRPVAEQYVGYIYDDILGAEVNFYTLFEKALIRQCIPISSDSINPILYSIEGEYRAYIRIDTVLVPSSSTLAARYALRATKMYFHYHFKNHDYSLEELGSIEGSLCADIKSTGSMKSFWDAEHDEHGNKTYSSFDGQDARLLSLPKDGFVVIYTLPYPPNIVMPGISMITLDANGNLSFSSSLRIFPPEWPSFSGREKNWSPFLFQGSVYFIKSINPLIVVRLNSYSNNARPLKETFEEKHLGNVTTSVVSTSKYIPGIDWGHLHMRGGSEARLIDNQFYLSFFHTQTRIQGSGLTTYFFGAYTFSPTPPFALLGVSRFPIIEKALYTGRWNTRFPRRKIDYVVFPMSFFVKNGTVHVAVGYQDECGWLLMLNLIELLTSLRNVTSM